MSALVCPCSSASVFPAQKHDRNAAIRQINSTVDLFDSCQTPGHTGRIYDITTTAKPITVQNETYTRLVSYL